MEGWEIAGLSRETKYNCCEEKPTREGKQVNTRIEVTEGKKASINNSGSKGDLAFIMALEQAGR